jgi:hypothetical protein
MSTVDHGRIMRLSVNEHVAPRVAEETPTTTPIKLPGPLPADNAAPTNIRMALGVVEAPVL